jgi:hypothetical protein
MPFNGMHGNTDDIRRAAGEIAAAKPVAPAWGVSPIPASVMGGVIALNEQCTVAKDRGLAFATEAAAGFDSFSQILQICATEYDQTDVAGAQNIARSEAANLGQIDKVNQLNGSRFFDQLNESNPGGTEFTLPPDVQEVN